MVLKLWVRRASSSSPLTGIGRRSPVLATRSAADEDAGAADQEQHQRELVQRALGRAHRLGEHDGLAVPGRQRDHPAVGAEVGPQRLDRVAVRDGQLTLVERRRRARQRVGHHGVLDVGRSVELPDLQVGAGQEGAGDLPQLGLHLRRVDRRLGARHQAVVQLLVEVAAHDHVRADRDQRDGAGHTSGGEQRDPATQREPARPPARATGVAGFGHGGVSLRT
jgi:hypothetical protein